MKVYIYPRTKGSGHSSISKTFYGRSKFLAKVIKIQISLWLFKNNFLLILL